MVIKPTYDDANLILRLYEERREDKMRAAREWFAQNFKFHTIEDFNRGCPPGSSMNAYARMIMSYWEMAASFVLNGAIDEKMFADANGEHVIVFAKIEPFLSEYRAKMGNPASYASLEQLVMRAPGANERLAALRERFRPRS